MSELLNPDQVAFAKRVANATGLKFQTVAAWLLCEEPASRSVELQAHNWLNLLNRGLGRRSGFSGVPIVGWNEAGFAKFRSLDDAVKETVYWVMRMSNYAGIRASRGKSILDQVDAIAASPWDAGHYRGGALIHETLGAVLRVWPAQPPRPIRPHYRISFVDRNGHEQLHSTRHLWLWVTRHPLAIRGKRVRQILRVG